MRPDYHMLDLAFGETLARAKLCRAMFPILGAAIGVHQAHAGKTMCGLFA